jgi:hypothetical protein
MASKSLPLKEGLILRQIRMIRDLSRLLNCLINCLMDVMLNFRSVVVMNPLEDHHRMVTAKRWISWKN